MVVLFEQCVGDQQVDARRQALSLAVSCVGGMIIARTLPDPELAREFRWVAPIDALQVETG